MVMSSPNSRKFSAPVSRLRTETVFHFADELGHGAYGAVYTPAAGLKRHYSYKSQHRRSEHNAVKTKGKLSSAKVNKRLMVSPVPRQHENAKKGLAESSELRFFVPFRKFFDLSALSSLRLLNAVSC